jgi:hypothetical protein
MGAQLNAVGGRFVPCSNRLLARLGVGELGLQLADVFVLPDKRLLDLLALMLQRRERLGDARLGMERSLGEVVASLGDTSLHYMLQFSMWLLSEWIS